MWGRGLMRNSLIVDIIGAGGLIIVEALLRARKP
jgi:hypothetical protein